LYIFSFLGSLSVVLYFCPSMFCIIFDHNICIKTVQFI
jgi:hypothetical protein